MVINLKTAKALELTISHSSGSAPCPNDTVLLPGHNYGGPASTIGDERRQNPFMRFASLGDFLQVMAGGRLRLP